MIDIGIAVVGTVITTVGAIFMDELVVPKVKNYGRITSNPFWN